MLKKLHYFVLNTLLVAAYLKEYLSFNYSLLDVEKTQKNLLLRILQKNKDTIYGKLYEFSSINSVEEFQSKVPITTYDSYKKYINLIRAGKKNVLTRDNVIMLEPTSGSTAPSKFIPYTKSLKKEFQNGIGPWIFDLYTKRKRLLLGSAYWSITPNINVKFPIKSKIPLGFEEDIEYFGFPQKLFLRLIFVVPKEIGEIEDLDNFKYITLLFLLKNKHIAFLSVWNPSFLALLMEPIMVWSDSLIKDITNGTITPPKNLDLELKNKILAKFSCDSKRAKELYLIFYKWKRKKLKNINYQKLWPDLQLISCWSNIVSYEYIKQIKITFPNVEIQGKGLIATEGFVSFPLIGELAPILAVNCHFFEFIDIETNEIKLAHQLTKNKTYSVLITTSGGLYRYKLQDLVKVAGYKMSIPLIKFIGKEDKISNLFGEKINEIHISNIFNKLTKKYKIKNNFFMIAPTKDDLGKISYVIYLELAKKINNTLLLQFVSDFEKELRKNYHYNYCRILQQLGNLRLFEIKSDGVKSFINALREKGQKLGNIKLSILNKDLNWSSHFIGDFKK